MDAKNIGNISAYKTPDGAGWMAQITIGTYENGKPKYKRFRGKKQKEVIEKAKQYFANNIGISDTTETYLEDFLKSYMINVKKHKLKPSSYDRELRTVELHIIPYIGHYLISQLTTDIIQVELMNKLVADSLAYSSIHKAYTCLNASLNFALSKGKINKNPCRDVIKPSPDNFESKEIRFLSEDELKQLRCQATLKYKNGKQRYKYGIPIILVSCTGIRCGELCALKWNDIDFDNKTMRISKNIATIYQDSVDDGSELPSQKRKRIVKEQNSTKTKNGYRYVPLNKTAITLLKQLKKMNNVDDNSPNYIVSNSTEPIGVDVVSGSYTSIAKAAKIENPLGIHTLRHTFASLLIKKGVDIKIVSEILGHSNVTITYNLYVHLIQEQKAQAVKLIDF